MITFDCCRCQKTHTEKNPKYWGEVNPHFDLHLACEQCIDNYNGPEDEYFDSFFEHQADYESIQEQNLMGAGRL